ncbi:GNAT family N-acetyltransferase [Vibrio breoganii]|uniref:GNAT family N-acetyltransferase n=1 Tax=Vibrio breoganii TaxID=553239 RepID=UPI000C823322|nr:GNAT family N-acetyltransferase [Vibrio breoganii]PMG92812.1 GNAT family N-acetyltransferase [Vibrio breoganii]PMJ49649.1 GNAT family N-acetyltransferase [Vibrio breoganii]PMK56661.1 GNAT family N-acetyltransferase [Vibrio breoganii]PMM82813.1 GNAT family N-acetyltransferase [Vibrio breoganii]PMO31429.1 GNAT family N-acetyltransferase [Vibrio breoganii]
MRVEIVDWQSKDEIFLVRNTVFTAEQGIDTNLDFDGLDEEAVHALVYDNDEPIATGRMLEDGHIGRIAVLISHRGKGLGTSIMKALVDEARLRSFSRVYLGAQVHALDFYQKLGFEPIGERYEEVGIEHQTMQLSLK